MHGSGQRVAIDARLNDKANGVDETDVTTDATVSYLLPVRTNVPRDIF